MLKHKYTRTLMSVVMLACLGAFGSAAGFAQNARLQLSQLDKLSARASQTANVTLEGPMLKLAAQAMQEKASKLNSSKKQMAAGLVERLKGVYVRNFEFANPGEYTKADLDSVMKQLQSGGWKAMVHVEEKKSGETTGIYVLEEGGEIVGMAVVAAEPKELTVVNLVGPIDFSQLGSLGSLGALGQLGRLAGNTENSKPELQHRPATTLKGQADSR
ncbi:MAG TPA: DUF4252 domain-containing protein [Candidatus Angelobacter sp.]|nr:DUF4252 domain-containing protein [Candidatus Angelobacter sp.]